jgi:hypothetical protein
MSNRHKGVLKALFLRLVLEELFEYLKQLLLGAAVT